MTPDPTRGAAACLAVLAAFLGLGLAGVLHHEPWRDEIEIWLIARDSASFGALLRNMQTEGHPILWYAVNFALARATADPIAMQLVNLALAAGAAAIFFRAAPFGWPTRLLFPFSYYALFEFGVIARSYALELLLLFGYCATASRQEGRMTAGGAALLAALANTNLFGTIMAGSLALSEAFAAWREDRPRLPARLPALALAAGGVALGFSHVLAQSLAIGPTHAGAYQPSWDLEWLLAGLAAPAFGALPFPALTTEHPWNTSLALHLPAPWHVFIPAAGTLGLAAAAAAALRARPRWLATYALGLVPMLALYLFVWFGSLRHHGQPFLWFLACAWLAGGFARAPGLAAILAVQVAACGALLAADLRRPFSSAKAAAAWLERPENAGALLAGSRDFAVEPILGWTRRPIWYPEQRRFGTFMDWGPRRVEVGEDVVTADAVEIVRRERRRLLLILTQRPQSLALGDEILLRSDVRARYVARFLGAIVADENYHVFSVEPVARAPRPAGLPPAGR